jgi:hypothetical protein
VVAYPDGVRGDRAGRWQGLGASGRLLLGLWQLLGRHVRPLLLRDVVLHALQLRQRVLDLLRVALQPRYGGAVGAAGLRLGQGSCLGGRLLGACAVALQLRVPVAGGAGAGLVASVAVVSGAPAALLLPLQFVPECILLRRALRCDLVR